MTSRIVCSIDYHGDSVLCFDPQKVLSKLAEAFPEVNIDRTDLSAAEVARIHEFSETLPAEQRETMLRQIAGKQQRNGPRYRFQISEDVRKHACRYSLEFVTEGRFDDDLSARIRQFMRSLEAGSITNNALD